MCICFFHFQCFFRNIRIQYFSILFHRLLRLWPTLAFVCFFQLTILKFFYNGPNYNDIDVYRYGCERTMWNTLLFVSNYLERGVSIQHKCRKYWSKCVFMVCVFKSASDWNSKALTHNLYCARPPFGVNFHVLNAKPAYGGIYKKNDSQGLFHLRVH